MFIAVLLAYCVLFAVIGYIVGKEKGRGADGFCLGTLLGIFGIIIIAVMPENSNGVKLEKRSSKSFYIIISLILIMFVPVIVFVLSLK